MACGPCEKRRQMLADAKRKDGAKGVVNAIPKVMRDLIKNPPNIRKGVRHG